MYWIMCHIILSAVFVVQVRTSHVCCCGGLCADMLYPDDLSICFLSFSFHTQHTDKKKNDRHKSEKEEKKKLKRLAQTLSDWQRGLAALLVNILLRGVDWQLKDVNDLTCTCSLILAGRCKSQKAGDTGVICKKNDEIQFNVLWFHSFLCYSEITNTNAKSRHSALTPDKSTQLKSVEPQKKKCS